MSRQAPTSGGAVDKSAHDPPPATRRGVERRDAIADGKGERRMDMHELLHVRALPLFMAVVRKRGATESLSLYVVVLEWYDAS